MEIKTVRLTGDLLKGVPYKTMAEDADESTTIRQLIRLGVGWCAVKLYKIGKITPHEAVELSNVTMKQQTRALDYARNL